MGHRNAPIGNFLLTSECYILTRVPVVEGVVHFRGMSPTAWGLAYSIFMLCALAGEKGGCG